MASIPSGMRPAGVPAGLKLGDVFFDEFFQYLATVTFTANQNLQVSIPIQADAHFLWVAAYMNCTAAAEQGTFQGACVNRGGSVVQVTDGGTQRQLSNVQVPADTLFGSAQRPFVLPLTKLFRANTNILLNVTDVTGAAQTTDYVFGGFKVPLEHGRMLGITN